MRVVSVHVPKAGGTSLLDAYRAAFGSDVVEHLSDEPINPLAQCRIDPEGYLRGARAEPWPDGRVVAHGHFPARRFEHRDDVTWVTFLRHPVERAISHYFYWLASPQQGHPLLDYVRSASMGFEAFVRLPLIRRIYSEVLFGGFDMGRFDFVGDTADLAGEFVRLGDVLSVDIPIVHARENPHPEYAVRAEAIRDDAELMARVHDVLAADIEFYEEHVGR